MYLCCAYKMTFYIKIDPFDIILFFLNSWQYNIWSKKFISSKVRHSDNNKHLHVQPNVSY